MIIIGERINSSRRSIAQAVESRNEKFIQNEAKIQEKAGSDYIDVNVGTFVERESDLLKWVVEKVQEVTNVPLCIDSPNPAVIKAVLPHVNKTPMINSVSLEQSRLERIISLVADYKTKVIALCQSEAIMAESFDDKMRLAGRLVKEITDAGVHVDNIYIDPLVYPVATDTDSAVATLYAIERIMKEYSGVHTTCGLTNVSYGIPNRRLVNKTFLIAAITRGLDSAIMDPTDKQLFGCLKAALMINGKDDFCMGYIESFREGRLE